MAMRALRRLVAAVACALAGLLLPASPALSAPTWTTTTALGIAWADQTATLLSDGEVLTAGGQGSVPGGLVTRSELYNPGGGIDAFDGELNTGRSEHTATVLPDGTVLVAGGLGPTVLGNAI